MEKLKFEWDDSKRATNFHKHKVSFEEAQSAFYDEQAIVFSDPDHSDDEDRFILLGISIRARVVIVCHCFRENKTTVRIISARKADKSEENDYWENRQ